MSSLGLYFLLMLDSLKQMLMTISIIATIALVVCLIIMFIAFLVKVDEGDEKEKCAFVIKGTLRVFWPVFIVWLLVFTPYHFIPTTKQMAVIYVAPKIINNEAVQKLPVNILKLTNEWLEELSPEKVISEVKETIGIIDTTGKK